MAEVLHDLLRTGNCLLHVSAAGAGPRLLASIWDNPGASDYLVGFFIPYATTQLDSFLGHPPENSYCSKEVAFDLAMASFIRAAEHRVIERLSGGPIGVGVTASVASAKMPKGEQRAHIVMITHDRVRHLEIDFEKAIGKGARIAQDEAIAGVVNREMELLLSITTNEIPGEDAQFALERFYRYPVFETNGTRHPKSNSEGGLYLPATLNPIHDGHRTMCQVAEAHLHPNGAGHRCARYLVSSTSPHKGTLSVQEMLLKAGMLRAERWRDQSRMVEFTRDEPLFIDKARKRPGSLFLIGADTMIRMLEPGWGPDVAEMLGEMKQLGVSFLVMGRQIEEKYVTCRDVDVPSPYGSLFQPLEGRVDVSSTEIRTREIG